MAMAAAMVMANPMAAHTVEITGTPIIPLAAAKGLAETAAAMMVSAPTAAVKAAPFLPASFKPDDALFLVGLDRTALIANDFRKLGQIYSNAFRESSGKAQERRR
jgi:hypothetical protein